MPSLAAGYYFLAQEGDRSGNFAPWDSGKQLDMLRSDDAARAALWGTIDDALRRMRRNAFAAAPVKGKETCGSCPYSSWCEESLA